MGDRDRDDAIVVDDTDDDERQPGTASTTAARSTTPTATPTPAAAAPGTATATGTKGTVAAVVGGGTTTTTTTTTGVGGGGGATSGLPWVEKYRPKNWDELVGHDDILATLRKLAESRKLPHLLFHGPPGTGKTSTILACAHQIFASNYRSMVLELNASDERGIDVVREQIKDFASTRTMFSNLPKLIILDEADAMTGAAQAALRRIMEKFTRNARFCLICNHVNKLIPAIQSRCTRFRFGPISTSGVRKCIERVAAAENIPITEDGYKALTVLGEGDMRKVLNILQSTFLAYGTVNSNNVYDSAGHPSPADMERCIQFLCNESFQVAYKEIDGICLEKGLALLDIVSELSFLVLRMTQLPVAERAKVLDKLARIEHRLAIGGSDKINLGHLVGTFQYVRNCLGVTDDEIEDS